MEQEASTLGAGHGSSDRCFQVITSWQDEDMFHAKAIRLSKK
jgi:hypothetical protein